MLMPGNGGDASGPGLPLAVRNRGLPAVIDDDLLRVGPTAGDEQLLERLRLARAMATLTPAMTVAWMIDEGRKPRLRIRVIGHQEMAPETSWELWMLPGENQPPKSLGLNVRSMAPPRSAPGAIGPAA